MFLARVWPQGHRAREIRGVRFSNAFWRTPHVVRHARSFAAVVRVTGPIVHQFLHTFGEPPRIAISHPIRPRFWAARALFSQARRQHLLAMNLDRFTPRRSGAAPV